MRGNFSYSRFQCFVSFDLNFPQKACETLLEIFPDDELLFCSEEEHFHISGSVNKQRCVIGAVKSRGNFMKSRVTVWCVLSRVGIISPYFFEENNHTVTVNGEPHTKMISQFLVTKFQEMDLGDV